ncbi:hypothetical protein HYH03_011050 [Edaphochlamys debaryana]|uniref:Uncharacterized protein n=1 Tax=Edaphochlamys debaryana TaxID=47281 RepID=A0A836BW54_9CHLO|nr:hypothetical protein HYH03_011050 [Edaphochlamys debaryana]|eukprot:KAG2490662.1 hypothetical protein HYH03_011050 [Edaphochlamys debaryana]
MTKHSSRAAAVANAAVQASLTVVSASCTARSVYGARTPGSTDKPPSPTALSALTSSNLAAAGLPAVATAVAEGLVVQGLAARAEGVAALPAPFRSLRACLTPPARPRPICRPPAPPTTPETAPGFDAFSTLATADACAGAGGLWGQSFGVVLTCSPCMAARAAKAVVAQYGEVADAVLAMEEALG